MRSEDVQAQAVDRSLIGTRGLSSAYLRSDTSDGGPGRSVAQVDPGRGTASLNSRRKCDLHGAAAAAGAVELTPRVGQCRQSRSWNGRRIDGIRQVDDRDRVKLDARSISAGPFGANGNSDEAVAHQNSLRSIRRTSPSPLQSTSRSGSTTIAASRNPGVDRRVLRIADALEGWPGNRAAMMSQSPLAAGRSPVPAVRGAARAFRGSCRCALRSTTRHRSLPGRRTAQGVLSRDDRQHRLPARRS